MSRVAIAIAVVGYVLGCAWVWFFIEARREER
jgi:hypothetical protein